MLISYRISYIKLENHFAILYPQVMSLFQDMNEPSNFYDGTVLGCNVSDSLNAPPFLPPGLVGGALYHKTLCGDARQYTGRHYTEHNLYGNMEAVATNVYVRATN